MKTDRKEGIGDWCSGRKRREKGHWKDGKGNWGGFASQK